MNPFPWEVMDAVVWSVKHLSENKTTLCEEPENTAVV